jgi:hypothetical protein
MANRRQLKKWAKRQKASRIPSEQVVQDLMQGLHEVRAWLRGEMDLRVTAIEINCTQQIGGGAELIVRWEEDG